MAETARPQLVAPRARPPATVGDLLSRDDETISRLRAVSTKYLPPDRALRLAIMAVRRTPRLAQCDPASFMGSLMSASGLGLEPNTVKGHAWLIPFEMNRPKREGGEIVKGGDGKWIWERYYECQFQIGYKGFVALFYRTGLITEVTAEAIYEGDKFEHRKGSENYLRYEKTLGPRGELLGAFCFTRLKDGEAFTILPADEVRKVRSRSQTWRTLTTNVENAANERDKARAERLLAETPWVMWESEMAAKTAIKRHGKQIDLDNPLLAVAADIDGLADAGALDIRAMADPELASEILQGDEEIPAQEDDDPAAAVTDQRSEPAPGSAATPSAAREATQGRRGQRTPAGRDAAPTASQGGEAARGAPEPSPPGEAVAQQTTSQQTTSQPAKPEPTNEPPKSDAPSQPAGEAAPPGAQPAQETGRRLPRRVNFEA